MTITEFFSKEINQLEVYTDGACSGNPGPGGWGVVLINGAENSTLNGGEANTTNNRMEMMAAVEAFNCIKKNSTLKEIIIYTDSKYVKDGITSWISKWKKNNWMTATKNPVKNQDLWQKLDEHTQYFKIDWRWVKGHDGNTYNEMADTLARKAIISQKVRN